MHKIRITSIGKSKEDYIAQWSSELQKRLQRFANVEVIELQKSEGRKDLIIKDNFNKFLKYLGSPNVSILLDVEGKKLNSIEFANNIKGSLDLGKNIDFFIGGAYGLDEKDKLNFNQRLSLSNMTLTHQQTKIILLEQIYRAFTIINKITYHY